jgi:hypothetical protein
VLFGFAKGQKLSEHTSTQSAVIQILLGECDIFLAGNTHAAKAGPKRPAMFHPEREIHFRRTILPEIFLVAKPSGVRSAKGICFAAKMSERGVSDTGHQNGHQTSKKLYSLVETDLLDSQMKSGIINLQLRGKLAESRHRHQLDNRQ